MEYIYFLIFRERRWKQQVHDNFRHHLLLYCHNYFADCRGCDHLQQPSTSLRFSKYLQFSKGNFVFKSYNSTTPKANKEEQSANFGETGVREKGNSTVIFVSGYYASFVLSTEYVSSTSFNFTIVEIWYVDSWFRIVLEKLSTFVPWLFQPIETCGKWI